MENNQKKFNDIPAYIKWNDDVDNPRFIPDGMNEVERNIKRIVLSWKKLTGYKST